MCEEGVCFLRTAGGFYSNTFYFSCTSQFYHEFLWKESSGTPERALFSGRIFSWFDECLFFEGLRVKKKTYPSTMCLGGCELSNDVAPTTVAPSSVCSGICFFLVLKCFSLIRFEPRNVEKPMIPTDRLVGWRARFSFDFF